MEMSARMLTKLRPIVGDLVRENSRDIRNYAQFTDPDEAENLKFIADTLDSAMISANKALETHTILDGIICQYKRTMDPVMIRQLQTVQTNQQYILQCNANTLLDSTKHYQQHYMPGSTTSQIILPNQNGNGIVTVDLMRFSEPIEISKSSDSIDSDNDQSLPAKKNESRKMNETLCLGIDSFSNKSMDGSGKDDLFCWNGFEDLFPIVNEDDNDGKGRFGFVEHSTKSNIDTLGVVDLKEEKKFSLIPSTFDTSTTVIADENINSSSEQSKKNSLQEYIRNREAYQQKVKALAQKGSREVNKKLQEQSQPQSQLQSQPQSQSLQFRVEMVEKNERDEKKKMEYIEGKKDEKEQTEVDDNNRRRKWIKVGVCVAHFLLGVATYLSNETLAPNTSNDPSSCNSNHTVKPENNQM